MINVTPLSADAYYETLRKLLKAAEDDFALPYVDTVGKTTIGRGFNIEGGDDQRTIRNIIFREIGIDSARAGLTDAQKAAEKSYASQLTAALDRPTTAEVQAAMNGVMARRAADPLFAGMAGVTGRKTFSMTPDEIENSFRSIMQTIYHAKVTRLTGATLADSPEKAALVSMSYLGTLDSRTAARIRDAINSPENGRAEAWFAIRYYALESYHQRTTAARFEINRNGYAKRLYMESQLFGLYDAGSTPSQDEAKQVYKMLATHRAEIMAHEGAYGVSPDGTPPSRRDMIAQANNDPVTRAVTTVQTLQQALNPARDSFVAWANTLLPPEATKLVAADLNSAAIFYNGVRGDPAGTDPTLDARILDGKGNGMEANLLVGETGANRLFGGKGNDTLIGRGEQDWLDGGAGTDVLVGGDGNDVLTGGAGNDTLYGGKGDDVYVWNTGDGADKIIETRDADGKIHGRIKINGGPGVDLAIGGAFVETAAGSNLYRNAATGLTLTHHSPWTLVLDDGSTLQLGESQDDFQDGDFGIHLVAATDAAFSPERVINGDLAPVDYSAEAGTQTRTDDLDNVITNGQPAPNRADILYDSAGSDLIAGGGGADFIEAWRGGNDKLDGGSGNDIVSGRAGDDIVMGGEGTDLLRGDGGKDKVFADAEITLEAAFAQQDAAPSGMKGDFIDAGQDDDQLVGGAGNDALNGGQGDDLILGGGGNDDIQGDVETEIVSMDWSVTREVIDSGGSRLYNTVYNGVGFDHPTAGGGDVIYGGGGDDWVSAGHGDDFVDGGIGNDVLFGQAGADDLLGGEGSDVLIGDSAGVPEAEHGSDYLDGGAGDDELDGGGANDQLFGGSGADQLYGGVSGDDYLDGGDGDDSLIGGSGADQVFGGEGADILQGDNGTGEGEGDDYLDGEGGDDVLFGEGGDDALFGGSGADQVSAGDGDDAVSGGDGADLLLGDAGNDLLLGDADDDQLQGGDGDDELSGGEGMDVLFGEAGNDTLFGDAGDDTLSGGLGDDVLDGGDGNNTLFGDEGNDILAGGAGATQFVGGLGDDLLFGGSGDDIYYYGFGDGIDRITDAGGTDWIVFSDISSGQVGLSVGSLKLTLPGGGELHLDDFDPDNPLEGAIEYFQFADRVLTRQELIAALGFDIGGTPGADELSGTALGDRLQAYESDDSVSAGGGNDTVDLGAGDDWAAGGAGDDVVAGQAGHDFISGGEGADTLDGGDGDDDLYGDEGNDSLAGGLGNDTLAGGSGADTLQGGAGVDTYLFGAGDGQDLVIDASGANTVRLTGGLLDTDVKLRQQGSDLVLEVTGSADRLTVKDWFGAGGAGWNLALGDGTVLDRAAVAARLVRNSAPVLVADSATINEDSTVQVSGNALANDSDPEGRALRVTNPGTYRGAYGTLRIDSAGAYSYTLDTASSAVQALAEGQVVTDTFAYTATDDDPSGAASAASSIAIAIRGSNDGPVVDQQSYTVWEDVVLSRAGNLLSGARDPDTGTVLQATPAVLQGAYGSVAIEADGSFVYTLDNDALAVQSLSSGRRATEQFTYTVTDGIGSVASTLEMSIYGENDAPVFVVPLPDQSVAAGATFSWQVPASSYTDIDQQDTLKIQSATLADGFELPYWLSFDRETGIFAGQAPLDATGYIDIAVTVTDGDPDAGWQETITPATDVFRLSFTAPGTGDGGDTGGKGNEGVGNGEDPPPPGHSGNFNDGPGTGPGNPGAKGGNGWGKVRPDAPQRRQPSALPGVAAAHDAGAGIETVLTDSDLKGARSGKKEDKPKKDGTGPGKAAGRGNKAGATEANLAQEPGLATEVNGGAAPASADAELAPASLRFADPAALGGALPGTGRAAAAGVVARWAALDRQLAAHLAADEAAGTGGEGTEAVPGSRPGAAATALNPLERSAAPRDGMAAFDGLKEGFRKIA